MVDVADQEEESSVIKKEEDEEDGEEEECRKYSPKQCSKLQFSIAQIMGFDKDTEQAEEQVRESMKIKWPLKGR